MIDSLPPKTLNKLVVAMIVVLAGGAFVGNQFILKPILSKTKLLQQDKGVEIQKKAVLEEILPLQKQIAQYQKTLSPTKDNAWLIEEMNKLAQVSGVALVSVTPANSEAITTDYSKTSLKLELRGNYHDIGGLVSRIESSQRFISIQELKLDVAPEASAAASGLLKASVIVATFYSSKT